jgi:hypothetical protein
MRTGTYCTLFAIGAAVCLSQPVRAQEVPTGSPDYLADRLADEDFELEVGSWTLTPSLSSGAGWSDNLAEEPDPEADYYVTNSAGFELAGKAGAADVDFSASVDSLLPVRLPEENSFDAYADLDIEGPIRDWLRGGMGFSFASYADSLSTSRYDREQWISVKPFTTLTFGKTELELRGTAGRVLFPAVDDGSGGTVADERQRSFANLVATASWEIRPEIEIFVGGLGRIAWYDNLLDDSGFRRGGHGFGAFAGIKTSAGKHIRAAVAAGVEHQAFLDPDFDSQTFATLDGYFQWRATDRLWLTALAETGFAESVDYGASGLLTYEGKLKAEYAAGAKAVLSALASYEIARYLYADILERTLNLEAGVDYQLAKHTVGSLKVSRKVRSSDDPDENFARNSVTASVKFN